MDQFVKRSNLLILRGVYVKDFTHSEPIFDKGAGTPPAPKADVIVYTEMPRRFTGVADWIKFSNLKCWSCDQLPASYPAFIPVNLGKSSTGEDECDVYGHFCHWGCAARFVTTELPKEQQWDALHAISLFESKFSGKRREKIMPAPSKTLMKPYCGDSGLTQKQWRELSNHMFADYNLTHYKMEHFKDTSV